MFIIAISEIFVIKVIENKMNTIKLSYSEAVNLISETVSRTLLKEYASPVLWHFTYLDALRSILMSNSLMFSKSYANHFKLQGISGYSEKRPYYLYTTRSKNAFDGYSRTLHDDNDECYARIELDGDKLNNIVHAKASDYFGTRYDAEEVELPYGKRSFYNNLENSDRHKLFYNNIQDYYKDSEDVKSNEKEDTLWYNKPYLKNASKYIKRIDIMILSDDFLMKNEDKFYEIKDLCDKLGIPVKFYNDVDKFNLQK